MKPETPPQPKQIKRITVPLVLRRVFDDFRRGRRIHRIARSQRVDRAEIEGVIVTGIRELLSRTSPPMFKAETRDGWGKPIQRAVVAMPVRAPGVAA